MLTRNKNKVKKMNNNRMKKLIGSKLLFFCLGSAFGIGLFAVLQMKKGDSNYYKLSDSYCIDDIGYLKKGVVLRVDKSMPEGFTRYVLYLNLSDAEKVLKYETANYGTIMPYWLNPKDSICD